MKEFLFTAELWLPRPREEIFHFFAAAHNLQVITPPWLTPPFEMRAGALIDYRLRVHEIPLRWRTRINEWDPPRRFVDEQLSGPYRLWHHTHEFEEAEGGTRCRDRVRYWPKGGAIMNALFVERDIRKIFAFRREKLIELFPK